jgi:hypothetical protein
MSALIWAYWQGMEAEIYAIRYYIDNVTSSFERGLKAYESYIEKQIAGAPDDDAIQSLGEGLGEAQGFLGDHFPSFALETTFVATYSLLEDEMLEIARLTGRHLGIALVPEDLSDKGIHAAKTYLEKLCGIAFPAGKHPWQEALHYNRIRNVFAHQRGRVKKDDNKVRKYVEGKKTSIQIDEHDRLKVSKEFCLEVLENVETLLNEVFKLVRDKVMPRQNKD